MQLRHFADPLKRLGNKLGLPGQGGLSTYVNADLANAPTYGRGGSELGRLLRLAQAL